MQKKQIVTAIAAILVICGLYYGGLKDWISLQALKENSHYFKDMVNHNYGLSAIGYIGIYTLFIAVSLPVVAPFTLLGGFLFGMMGALFALLSSILGSILYVIIFRHFLYNSMYEQFKDQLVQFKDKIALQGKSYVLILHLMAAIPFFVINSLAALADFTFWDIAWTTALGNMPLLILLAYEGRELSHIESMSDILSPHFIIGIALLMMLAFLPIIIQRLRARKSNQ